MSTLVLAWPYASLLLLLLPLLWWLNRQKNMAALAAPMALYLGKFIKNKPIRFSRNDIILGLMWLLLVLAALRPQLRGQPIYIPKEGRGIMLALDISESMELMDMHVNNKPVSRLLAAKEALNTFIDKRPVDRIGLVVFGSEAFLHAPLSFDHKLIKHFLDDAEIGLAGAKTAIGDAIALATKKLLDEAEGEKIIILLTDGQNNDGVLSPKEAAALAHKHNIKLYIAGLGSSRMVVDGFFGPEAINPSLSLDQAEPELKNMAALTNGLYFRAKDFAHLQEIYDKIDAMEPIKSDPEVIIPHKEIFYWPLLGFLILVIFKLMKRNIYVV